MLFSDYTQIRVGTLLQEMNTIKRYSVCEKYADGAFLALPVALNAGLRPVIVSEQNYGIYELVKI